MAQKELIVIPVDCIRFVDDVVVLADNKENVVELHEDVDEKCKDRIMRINREEQEYDYIRERRKGKRRIEGEKTELDEAVQASGKHCDYPILSYSVRLYH